MPYFRKRPVVIEAIQVTPENWSALYRAFVPNTKTPMVLVSYAPPGSVEPVPSHVEITTLEGTMRGEMGDWIICGVQGELYPCKPDIFTASYEPAESDV